MLYGRKAETEALQRRYDSGRFEFMPVYGRRRVGKTALLTEFAKGRNAAYVFATDGGLEENMGNLTEALTGYRMEGMPFREVLGIVEEKARRERFMLIIDEYPNLAGSARGVSSNLQAFIDRVSGDSKLFLVLCGSSLTMMAEEVLGAKSPLYGRRTCSLKLEPLPYREARLMLEGFPEEDRMRIYSMVGGVPMYLKHFDPGLSLRENVARNFLDAEAFFRDEDTILLLTEFRIPSTYSRVLAAVAGGLSRNSEIAQKAGMDPTLSARYLRDLCEVGLIVKEHPADNPAGKATRYRVKDRFMRFQYGHARRHRSAAAGTDALKAADDVIALVDADIGSAFEEACAEYLTARFGGEPLRWWGGDPETGVQEAIDIIQTVASGGATVGYFAECKYRGEPVGPSVLDTLVRRSRLVHGYDEVHYVLFSKSGFTDGFEGRDALLLTYEDVARGPEVQD